MRLLLVLVVGECLFSRVFASGLYQSAKMMMMMMIGSL